MRQFMCRHMSKWCHSSGLLNQKQLSLKEKFSAVISQSFGFSEKLCSFVYPVLNVEFWGKKGGKLPYFEALRGLENSFTIFKPVTAGAPNGRLMFCTWMIGSYLFENQFQCAFWVHDFEVLGYFGNMSVIN